MVTVSFSYEGSQKKKKMTNVSTYKMLLFAFFFFSSSHLILFSIFVLFHLKTCPAARSQKPLGQPLIWLKCLDLCTFKVRPQLADTGSHYTYAHSALSCIISTLEVGCNESQHPLSVSSLCIQPGFSNPSLGAFLHTLPLCFFQQHIL